MRRRVNLRLILAAMPILAAALLTPGAGAQEQAPEAPVRALSDKLIDVMRRAKDLGYEGRFRELQPVVERSFDMPLMSRLALGPGASDLGADQQARLAASFARYSVAQYASSFSDYSGERIDIGQTDRRANGDAVVRSKLVPRQGPSTELDYLLRKSADGGWRIIDVYLDGSVSQLALRRSELGGVFKRSGFDGLIAGLDAKSAQMAKP